MKRSESGSRTLSARVFSLLLFLLPSAFRRRFGHEMTEALDQSIRARGRTSRRLSVFVVAVWDLVRGIVPEWLSQVRGEAQPERGSRGGRRLEPTGGRARVGSFLGDVRFALRALRRRPLFAAVAITTMGLGIGASTSMFSVVNGVLLHPGPYRDPGQLVEVWQVRPDWKDRAGLSHMWQNLGVSFPQFEDWRRDQSSFESVAIFYAGEGSEMTLTEVGPARRLSVGVASATLLPTLGVEPILGRGFLPDEQASAGEPSARVALVSHEFWQGQLGADPNVVGRDLMLDGSPFTVVGVLPEGFRFQSMGRGRERDVQGVQDLWILPGAGSLTTSRSSNMYDAIARIRPGVTLEEATADVQASMFQGAPQSERSARLVSRGEEELMGFSSPLLLLLGATGILFLLGCVNTAVLSLSELYDRGPELSTRRALGAGRLRVGRQLLTESVVLGGFGSLFGIAVAWAGMKALVALAPPLPRLQEVSVNPEVLGFATGLGLLSGILFGALPALVSAHFRPSILNIRNSVGSAASGGRLQRGMLSLQVALTVSLLVPGGLLARTLYALRSVDPGFRAEGLATVRISIPPHLLEPPFPASEPLDEKAEKARLHEARSRVVGMLLERLAGLPGVTSVTASDVLPFPGDRVSSTTVRIGGGNGSGSRLDPDRLRVWPGFHETMGIPLLTGRAFTQADGREHARVTIISESFARRYWPDRSPLGETIDDFEGVPLVVVGVVGDMKVGSLIAAARPTYYLPFQQMATSDVSLLVRGAGAAGALAGEMRRAVHGLDATIPVSEEAALRAMVAWSTREEEYRALLMGVFAILAAVLAGLGIYGATTRGVRQRSRELGIRIAVGACGARLVSRTVMESFRTSLLGLALGLLLAFWASDLLDGFLFGVGVLDASTYGAVAALVVVLSGSASFFPARRISRIDPARVLREE